MVLMKKFNLVAAIVTATVLAGAAFQISLGGADSPSGWRVLAGWALAAVVWALVFGFVRDGIRPTLASVRRR